MSVTIEKATDLKALSFFLSNINKQKKFHIGYCGQNSEEIYQTLKADFIDENGNIKFLIVKSNRGEIVAAIGLDIDESSAEVWGPFNQTLSMSVQHELWKQLLYANPTVKSFQFFINQENKQQQMFMYELQAEKTGEHFILEIKQQNFEKVCEKKSVLYTQDDFQAFEKLHQETFPGTYYNAKTITDRLSDKNILKVLKTESNELQGYAYYEVDPKMEDASLEYISIASTYQNQGLGTMMLREVLTEMFSYPQINNIRLTVNNTTSQANHVYIKAGFTPKYILNSYDLKL